MVCVTALPCKNLTTTLVMFTAILVHKSAKSLNCLQKAYRLHTDIIMIVKDIFACISWKTGRTSQTDGDGECRKSDCMKFLARSLEGRSRKGQRTMKK